MGLAKEKVLEERGEISIRKLFGIKSNQLESCINDFNDDIAVA